MSDQSITQATVANVLGSAKFLGAGRGEHARFTPPGPLQGASIRTRAMGLPSLVTQDRDQRLAANVEMRDWFVACLLMCSTGRIVLRRRGTDRHPKAGLQSAQSPKKSPAQRGVWRGSVGRSCPKSVGPRATPQPLAWSPACRNASLKRGIWVVSLGMAEAGGHRNHRHEPGRSACHGRQADRGIIAPEAFVSSAMALPGPMRTCHAARGRSHAPARPGALRLGAPLPVNRRFSSGRRPGVRRSVPCPDSASGGPAAADGASRSLRAPRR